MIPILAKRVIIMGFISIWRHRLRSGLTVLGIVFGVCSVIAMLAIGEGASYEAQEQIKRLGSQNIIINSVEPPASESVSKETQRMQEYGLTYKDAERIVDTIPTVDVIVPSRKIRADVTYSRKRLTADAHGTVPWYPEISNSKIIKGRFFTRLEMDDKKNVCVLDKKLAQRIYTFEDPIGTTIRIKGSYFKVIGVIEKSGTGESQTNGKGDSGLSLYIPLNAAKEYYGEIIMNSGTGSFSMEKIELHQIIVKVKSLDNVVDAAAIIKSILEKAHKEVDYDLVVPLQLLREAQRTKRIFSIVLGSIAAISLLVGGIGIMNIMLASVTERTREIGIRRALGAKRKDIITQFLTETILLSSSGGIIGLVVGVVIPFTISRLTDMMTIVRLWSLFGAFGISVMIGLVFGIYPAYRAAMMNPIEALRHE